MHSPPGAYILEKVDANPMEYPHNDQELHYCKVDLSPLEIFSFLVLTHASNIIMVIKGLLERWKRHHVRQASTVPTLSAPKAFGDDAACTAICEGTATLQ